MPIIGGPIFFPPRPDLPIGVFAFPLPGIPFFLGLAIILVFFEEGPIFPDIFFDAFIMADSRSDATRK